MLFQNHYLQPAYAAFRVPDLALSNSRLRLTEHHTESPLT